MDAGEARLALSPQVLSLVAALPPYDHANALSLNEQLRAGGADPAVVSAALTQSRLRASARSKLGDFAEGMLFTQAGLEQATRLVVAAHHAQRFRAAGVTSVADLTCGLGVDSMALAGLGIRVTAFEIDEATALLADYNVRHWDDARVVWADAMETLARGRLAVEGIFADPARRTQRGRRHDPKDYSPPLDDVLDLASTYSSVGVKVGPGIDHAAVPAGALAQWVSVDGDVVEAGLWLGDLADGGGHSALVIAHGHAHEFRAPVKPGTVGSLQEYLYEPDGAVIRAGLVGPVADMLGATLVDDTIAYLTADRLPDSPFVKGFRILEVVDYSERAIAKALAARDVGTLEIKKRGMDIDPDTLRKRLKLKGKGKATLFATRVDARRVGIVAERLQ